MSFLGEVDNLGFRKVLIEKYSSRAWMLKWIKKQKEKFVRTQNYEDAVKWRDVERCFHEIEEDEEKHQFRCEFDEIFFYLYENLE